MQLDMEIFLPYLDMLFRVALSKTHNADEADELIQETYLGVLSAIRGGKVIENPKAYLLSTLNNRFFMSLRKKYRISIVSFDVLPYELLADEDCFSDIDNTDEAMFIRKALAFMAQIYREVMIRYYMQNQSVETIANELDIPKGTVLSRLDVGRKKVKKGVEQMENYAKQSYQPEKLTIGINGRTGQGGEPFSCVKGALIENILIVAYEKPLTVTEISQALGTPLAFIEESVDYLVKNELMKKDGTKVCTDFVITSLDDSLKDVATSKAYAKETFDTANKIFLDMTEQYKEMDCFKNQSDTWLYNLAALSVSTGYWDKLREAVGEKPLNFNDFPDRPNFGKWIASGGHLPGNYDFYDLTCDRIKYSVSGRFGMSEINENIKNMFEWATSIGFTHNNIYKYSLSEKDRAIAIDAVINGTATPFQMEFIPDLEKYCFIENKDGKWISLIPYLSADEEKHFFEIESMASKRYIENLADIAVGYIKSNKRNIPKHITIVPSLHNINAITDSPMAYVFEAAERGVITIENGKNYPIMCVVKR